MLVPVLKHREKASESLMFPSEKEERKKRETQDVIL